MSKCIFTVGQRVNTFTFGAGTIIARESFTSGQAYVIIIDDLDSRRNLSEWGYSDHGLLIRWEAELNALDVFVDPAMA